jgi:hypothetical protein
LQEGKEVQHENEAAEEAVENLTTTRSGRVVTIPADLPEDYEASNVQIGLTRAEEHYYATIVSIEYGFIYVDDAEAAMVGAGVDGRLVNTNELHTIEYDGAMASKDRIKWIKAVEEEYVSIMDHGVFESTEL